ncbi:MAG: leucine-rich repeat domain-containing protein [Spirochaetales bacterium]|nr:leucine-rich repeat domain-containing protein [Spirochaetales bacterium]
MTLKELYDFIRKNLTIDRLKELSQQIIDAYKSRNEVKLMAFTPVLPSGSPQAAPETGSRLFFRLIKFFHPDRYNSMVREVEESYLEENEGKLLFFKQLLSIDKSAARELAERFEFENREMYGFDAGDLDSPAHPLRKSSKKFDFFSAVKSELYGNLGFSLDPADLASLTDDLDLSDYGLNDLDGLEYCRNITSLNLSGNILDNIHEIQFLDYLKELYLSGNEITDIDDLAGLSNLEIIDLSGNDIEDLSPLLLMDSLKFVDISGNPIADKSVITALERKGVVIISR